MSDRRPRCTGCSLNQESRRRRWPTDPAVFRATLLIRGAFPSETSVRVAVGQGSPWASGKSLGNRPIDAQSAVGHAGTWDQMSGKPATPTGRRRSTGNPGFAPGRTTPFGLLLTPRPDDELHDVSGCNRPSTHVQRVDRRSNGQLGDHGRPELSEWTARISFGIPDVEVEDVEGTQPDVSGDGDGPDLAIGQAHQPQDDSLLIASLSGGEGGTYRLVGLASASFVPKEFPVVACARFRSRHNFGARGRVRVRIRTAIGGHPSSARRRT